MSEPSPPLWQVINRHPVTDRQCRVINRLLGDFKGKLSISRYATLAGCSTDSAMPDVRELLERGLVVQNPS